MIPLTSPSVVRSLLARHKIQLKKSLGQHLLIDENVLKKIVSSARLGPEDIVVEIGAGIGTLTQELAQRAKRVVAVEIDPRLIPLLLRSVQLHPNVQIVQQDFLTFNLEPVAREQKISVVGNLPYNVTAPILEKLVEAHQVLASATLLVQLEVAKKLCAAPGTRDAGSITIFVQSFADVQMLMRVSRHVFFPKPEVDSALIHLRFLDSPKFHAPEELFFKVVRAAFNLRRKTLRQSLTQSPFLALPVQTILQALEQAQLDPKRRGEALTIEEFDRLAQALA